MRFYWKLYVAALRSRAAYRVDLFAGILTTLFVQCGTLAFYWVVRSRAASLGGWSPSTVLFLFGVTAMGLALAEALFNGIWHLPTYVHDGYVDRLLLYPVRSLLFVLVARPELHSIGNFLAGVGMVAIAFSMSPPAPVTYLLLPIWVVSTAVIYAACLVSVASWTFKIRGPLGPQYFILLHLLGAARYPIHIYPAWLKLVLLSVFPIGFATYLPGAWLEGAGESWLVALAPPVVAALASLVALAAWQLGLRSYQRAA